MKIKIMISALVAFFLIPTSSSKESDSLIQLTRAIGDTVDVKSNTLFSQSEAKNVLYIEFLGNGGFISANYERFLTQNLSLRIGMGSLFGLVTVTFPVMVNYCFGKEYRFEIGGGLLHVPEGKWDGTVPTATLGYRYQDITGGTVFRISFTPLINESGEIFFWGGLSFGYAL